MMTTLLRNTSVLALAALCSLAAIACKGDPPADQAMDRAPTSPTSLNPIPMSTTSGAGGSSSSSVSNPPPPSGGAGAGGSSMKSSTGGAKADAGRSPTLDSGTHDAGPPLPTACAGDDAGLEEADGGNPRNCLVTSDLHVQYLAADTNPTDNQCKPHFNIVNHGTSTQNLADLSVRYWFSDSSSVPFSFACDYAQIGCGSVSARFVMSDRPNANHYLELSFTGGSLSGGAQTGEIQARFNHQDYSNLDQNDDYSFDASKTSFSDWYKVTLYRAGVLVWGAEP